MPKPERLTATVHGRVQGVGYRIFVKEMAVRLGIRGTVKNLPDGSVGVVAEARPTALDQLEIALHTGSPASRVERIDLERATGTGKLKKFVVVW